MSQPLKEVYNRAYLEQLSRAFVDVYPAFPVETFITAVLDQQWGERELKARTQHIRHCLHQSLAMPYENAIELLKAVAPDFSGYEAMFFPDYVDAYGREHWSISMDAMQWLTQFSSAEFAVRPFILQDQARMMEQMCHWSEHENYHVRRLASEGCRPRLPWAQALPLFKNDPAPILPILHNLRSDESDYVRRSVANNLNDIAKDNPDITIEWADRLRGDHKHTDWIIKHGCRTLLKQAHPQVMALFGYHPAEEIAVNTLLLDENAVKIGDTLGFEFVLKAKTGILGRLRIEYGVDYRKANGSLSRKIFKIAEGEYAELQRAFSRTQSFRQMSTRKHYAGLHRLAILVNGEEKAITEFELRYEPGDSLPRLS